MHPHLPRYQLSRRTLLRRSLLAGGALVAAPLLASCGDDDADVFDGGSGSTAAPSTSGAPTGDASTSTTAVAGSTAPATTVPSTPGSAAVPAGDALPDGAQLQVAFTYTASGGRVKNPYIVVWVETRTGELVQTISVWYSTREAKYLRELTNWYVSESNYLDGGGADNVASVSGATRNAGTYQVVWDGRDAAGAPVAQGDYVLLVESAREHGPHQVTSADISLGSEGFAVTLPDDGELTALSATYVV